MSPTPVAGFRGRAARAEPPAQPSDGGNDRQFGLRLALISAGAALAGALIGGAVSFGGVVYTGSNAAHQSQADFLRQQRVAVYSKFLLDVDALDVSLAHCDNISTLKGKLKPDDAQTQLAAALYTVRADIATVKAVGSSEAASLAQAMGEELLFLDNSGYCEALTLAPDYLSYNIVKDRWIAVDKRRDKISVQIRIDVGAEGI